MIFQSLTSDLEDAVAAGRHRPVRPGCGGSARQTMVELVIPRADDADEHHQARDRCTRCLRLRRGRDRRRHDPVQRHLRRDADGDRVGRTAVQGFAGRSPAEIKSLLMNYAETDIWNGAPDAPVSAPLAAIQRIGAGEVRVDRAVAGADLAAWDSEAMTGALSFGFVDGAQDMDVTREVTVANYGASPQTLTITPSFRFEDDETNGAVQVTAPPSVVVPAADVDGPGTATFDVTLSIEAGILRDWTANSGGDGANPAPLTSSSTTGTSSSTTGRSIRSTSRGTCCHGSPARRRPQAAPWPLSARPMEFRPAPPR